MVFRMYSVLGRSSQEKGTLWGRKVRSWLFSLQSALLWFPFLACPPSSFFPSKRTILLLFHLSSNLYEHCSKSNASCFIVLVHNIRGGCWWYGSSSWTFPSIFCYISLLCDKWQQRKKCSLTQKCIWRKGVSLNFSVQKKKCTHWHFCMLTNHLWRPSSGCEFSEVVGGVFKWHFKWPCPAVTPWNKEYFDQLMFTNYLVVVTMLKNKCFVAENLLYQTILMCSLYLL